MIIIKYSFIVLFIVYLYGCSSSDGNIWRNKLKTGSYDYVMTDSSGIKLTNGVIKIDYVKGENFSGTYTVIKDPAIDFEGKSTMNNGPFSGYYKDTLSYIFFNMNPKMADANVFINATDYNDSLKGSWYYSTFRGKTTGGLFNAKKLKSK